MSITPTDLKKLNTSITSIDFIELAHNTRNIYKTVAILGIRSNQVSSNLKASLNEKLAEFGSSSDSLEEIQENREQIEIARQFEQLPKPTLIAINEYFQGKLYYRDGKDNL